MIHSCNGSYTSLTDHIRTFLLFIPHHTPSLRAIMSYYSSTVTVNPEGDVHVSDETIEGLGNHQFLKLLFGGSIRVLGLQASSTYTVGPVPPRSERIDAVRDEARCDTTDFPWDPGDIVIDHDVISERYVIESLALEATRRPSIQGMLTGLFPAPGYFVAGGLAGAVSRTATAPLDRLKVYLIAQVGAKDEAVRAVKSGAPVQAAKTAARPLRDAVRVLWRMGGMQSLFAGR